MEKYLNVVTINEMAYRTLVTLLGSDDEAIAGRAAEAILEANQGRGMLEVLVTLDEDEVLEDTSN